MAIEDASSQPQRLDENSHGQAQHIAFCTPKGCRRIAIGSASRRTAHGSGSSDVFQPERLYENSRGHRPRIAVEQVFSLQCPKRDSACLCETPPIERNAVTTDVAPPLVGSVPSERLVTRATPGHALRHAQGVALHFVHPTTDVVRSRGQDARPPQTSTSTRSAQDESGCSHKEKYKRRRLGCRSF